MLDGQGKTGLVHRIEWTSLFISMTWKTQKLGIERSLKIRDF